jgi:hypothetical protein
LLPALQALKRRGIAGKATEIKTLWRGNYQLDLVCPDISEIEVITVLVAVFR